MTTRLEELGAAYLAAHVDYERANAAWYAAWDAYAAELEKTREENPND
jgi:hypothetical protein